MDHSLSVAVGKQSKDLCPHAVGVPNTCPASNLEASRTKKQKLSNSVPGHLDVQVSPPSSQSQYMLE